MNFEVGLPSTWGLVTPLENEVDAYFSADIETDGPIPGPYSMLSFAVTFAGTYDGKVFSRPKHYDLNFYRELKPISPQFDPEALQINGLDRDRLCTTGADPREAMVDAYEWICEIAKTRNPVLVAYPLSFDWSWLYWYFMNFARKSPFKHSRCFDIKTAFAVKAKIPISAAGMSNLPRELKSHRRHSHHALDDAIEQAEIFANICEWEIKNGRT